MSQDDSTVRLPGNSAGLGGEYTPEGGSVPDRGFGHGGDYPTSETRYEAGYAAPESDQTLLIGAGGWEPDEDRKPAPVRDRLLVHGIWELLLLVLVGALGAFCYVTEPKLFAGVGIRQIEVQAATLGLLAIAVAISLRAATPNLAVGAFAAVAGLMFARGYEHSMVGAVLPAIGVALLGGLALGVLVALLHVPGWAASLVALCGGFVVFGAVNTSGATGVAGSPPELADYAPILFAAVAGISVVLGLLGLFGPLRRTVGVFRPVADPAARRGPGAALMVVVALTASAGLAGGAGVLTTLNVRTSTGTGMVSDLVLALGAVLLGGVSAYGRRGGMLGTMLGVLAIVLVMRLGAFRGWPSAVTTYAVAGGAIVLGLLVTRLIEWGGRDRSAA